MSRSSPLASVSAPSAEISSLPGAPGPDSGLSLRVLVIFSRNFTPVCHTRHSEGMWVGLCTTQLIAGVVTPLGCTVVIRPHPPNTSPTGVHAAMHKPIAALAGPRGRCPQLAQALILVLRSLHRFFFEIQAWGRPVHTRRPRLGQLGLSGFAISFQDGVEGSTVVLRLPLRSPLAHHMSSAFVAEPRASGGRLANGFETLSR